MTGTGGAAAATKGKPKAKPPRRPRKHVSRSKKGPSRVLPVRLPASASASQPTTAGSPPPSNAARASESPSRMSPGNVERVLGAMRDHPPPRSPVRDQQGDEFPPRSPVRPSDVLPAASLRRGKRNRTAVQLFRDIATQSSADEVRTTSTPTSDEPSPDGSKDSPTLDDQSSEDEDVGNDSPQIDFTRYPELEDGELVMVPIPSVDNMEDEMMLGPEIQGPES